MNCTWLIHGSTLQPDSRGPHGLELFSEHVEEVGKTHLRARMLAWTSHTNFEFANLLDETQVDTQCELIQLSAEGESMQ